MINSSPETVVEVVSTLRRNVPYFYDTFWVIKFTLVSALILCLPKQPWWSAALAHTITWCMTMPQPSMQVSSSHHGQCHLRLVWAQSIWGTTGTWSHHEYVFIFTLASSQFLSSPDRAPSFLTGHPGGGRGGSSRRAVRLPAPQHRQ